MENQIENNQNPDEEISLIDLFAVLLRYRKLIIIGTLVVTFLAGLYLFVLPKLLPDMDKKTSVVVYDVAVNRLPLTVERQLPNATGNANLVLGLAMSNIRDLPFFKSIYQDYLLFSLSDKGPETEAELNHIIQDLFEAEKVVTKQGALGAALKLELTVPDANIEKTEPFVQKLVTETNEKLKVYLFPLLENLKKTTTETITVMERQTASMMNSTQDLNRILLDLDTYMANFDNFVVLESAPFIVPVAQGRMTKLVIVAFAAFFVTVFLAFVLNAIKNIKADPQASKVLSEAWKAGK